MKTTIHLTPEEAELLRTVKEIWLQKSKRGTFPTFSLSVEVIPRLSGKTAEKCPEIAEKLRDLGLIKIGRTINYDYYDLSDSLKNSV